MSKKLKLLNNIQFIYELALAKLELGSFCKNFNVTNDFREFILKSDDDLRRLKKRLAYFKTINAEKTDYYYLQKYNQTKSVNQYITHWFYPYKGKFHPQMIRALLNIIDIKEGDTVLDPFVGSGTTCLESMLLGINAIGYDISPLCILISKVKCESIDVIKELKEYKEKFIEKFTNQTNLFTKKAEIKTKNQKVNNFFQLAKMIAHSDNSRRRRNFQKSLKDNVLKMINSVDDLEKAKNKLKLNFGNVEINKADARKLPLETNSIDGVITSPPYSIALNYVANDAHSLEALGYDLERIKDEFIGVRGNGQNKFDLYEEDMGKCYKEMYRVLKKGKYCVIVIGNVTFQGKEIETTNNVVKHSEKAGFKLERKIAKLIYGLYNVMQKEYILIFKK